MQLNNDIDNDININADNFKIDFIDCTKYLMIK